MTAGALVAAAGLALLVRVEPGARYLTGVLPGVVTLGIGLGLAVAPLTLGGAVGGRARAGRGSPPG